MNRIPIDDVMRGVTGKYKSTWKSWEDKLNNFLLHTGDYFNNDNTTLYQLNTQYIGTEGVGSNIINKYHPTNNGRKCHHNFDILS